MATVDAIYDKIKNYSQYSGLSEQELYDIADILYKKGVYLRLSNFFQGQTDPFSPFYGENAIWGRFTYVEIIKMEEEGVLIPEKVLSWAHSMQDSDCTNYDTEETYTSDDAAGLEQETADNSKESKLITLKTTAQAMIAQCRNKENQLEAETDVIDSMKKNAESKKEQSANIQQEALNKVQNIIFEWKNLESKLKRNIPLSETEQKRFDELSTLLKVENKQYVNEINNLNLDFNEIASELSEIESLNQNTLTLSNEAERLGKEITEGEAKHNFTMTSKSKAVLTGVDSVIISSSVSKTLAQTAIETGITTNALTESVQIEVNEIASMIDVSTSAKNQSKSKVQSAPVFSKTQTRNTENQMKDEAENEFQNTKDVSENSTTQKIKSTTASSSVAPVKKSVQTQGTASITEGTGVTETSTATVENDTLSTDNTEESGNEMKAKAQEQIMQCNTRASEITNAVNGIEPMKKAVEDIQKESKLQSKMYDAKIEKYLDNYQTICDKIRNGDELSATEEATFKKLNTELDKTNGNYVKGLDSKINTLSSYTRSLNYAFDIVNEGFSIANTTVETGKQLAIQELGDRSYLMKSFFFMLLNDERQKDLLYGKAGESVGRDAIDRGELLAQESTDATTALNNQIPLSNFAQEEAGALMEKKNNFVDKVTEITKNVPGIDASTNKFQSEDKILHSQGATNTATNTINPTGTNTTTNQPKAENQRTDIPVTGTTNFKTKGQSTEKTKAVEGGQEKTDKGEEINAKNGKQAAKECQKESAKNKQQARTSEENTKEMEKTDKEAQKSDKKFQKDSKTLNKQMKKNQKELDQTEKQVEQTAKQIDEEEVTITNLQNEVEGLVTLGENQAGNTEATLDPQEQAPTNAGFTIAANPTIAATTATVSDTAEQSETQTKIDELNAQIITHSTRAGLYSNKLVKYQTKSAKTIKTMKVTNKKYNKVVKQEQKQKKEDVSKSDKVLKVAETIEGISSTVATVGFIVGTTGDILQKVILPPWIPIIGAVMSPIGHTAEAIGNYGVLAANLTKTAVYAAQGNLMGALMSAGMAVMAGAAAVSATGQAGKGFQNMGKNIANASAKATIVQGAKDTLKSATATTFQKTVAQGTLNASKQAVKQGLSMTFKAAGKQILMNAGNFYNTANTLFGKEDNQDNKQQKGYTTSDRFKKIQRKNAKRRANIQKRRNY